MLGSLSLSKALQASTLFVIGLQLSFRGDAFYLHLRRCALPLKSPFALNSMSAKLILVPCLGDRTTQAEKAPCGHTVVKFLLLQRHFLW